MLNRLLYYLSIIGVIFLSTVLGASFFLFHNYVVDFSRLEQYNPGQPTIILDDQGNEWARFQIDRRQIVTLDQMPAHVIHAFLSAEDWHFFDHCGISWRGMIRSLLVNLYHGRRAQGASTITQQLIRLLFFDAQKTMIRKIKEQVCALLVEQQFSKEHILQTYLNHIYFGCGIYGVEAASQRFWGKSVCDLEPHESATLAAVICSPKYYCPLLCPRSAQRRRDIILTSMHKCGYITNEVYKSSLIIPVFTQENTKQEQIAPHAKEMLRIQLEALVGKTMVYTGGLIVQTTLNARMQKHAERAFKRHITRLRQEREDIPFDGGLLSIETETGDIKALVGGYDFVASKFNRPFDAHRQLGSAFKPIVYAAAIENGCSFDQVLEDEPFEMQQGSRVWRPQNHTEIFEGPMTRAYALSHSNNIITIKTLLEIGADTVVEMARRCGFSGLIRPYPSLALGCIDPTLRQAVAMFNVFANNGVYVEPSFLVSVKDRWGRKVYKRDLQESKQVLSSKVCGQVTKVLGLGMSRLQKRFAQSWIDVDAISKTGTTNDCRTCWFMGSTPTITTGVCIGCDDNRSMGTVFPIYTAFPIWLDLQRCITHPQKEFLYDPQLKEITIHEKTGELLVDSNHPEAITILVS